MIEKGGRGSRRHMHRVIERNRQLRGNVRNVSRDEYCARDLFPPLRQQIRDRGRPKDTVALAGDEERLVNRSETRAVGADELRGRGDITLQIQEFRGELWFCGPAEACLQ